MDPGTVTPPFVARPFRLAPFRAVRLNPTRVGDPASARLLSRPYAGAADRIDRWHRRGLLHHDSAAALHIHEYTVGGLTVRGLVGALDVSRRAGRPADRAVLPHEGIYPAQADDLADRMAQLRVNPAPILLAQDSPGTLRDLLSAARGQHPDHQYVDRAGLAHRVWSIYDDDRVAEIQELLAPTSALIADGHHRYAAYLRLQQRDPGGPCDRGLAMVVDQQDTPLFLGAIHRVLVGSALSDVEDAASVVGLPSRRVSADDALAALGPARLVATDSKSWLVVDVSSEQELLEVEVLHQRLVPTLAHGPSRTTYHHTAHEALDHCGPDLGTAVLLPAATVARVQRLVEAGRLLPEKATSFQPKPAFGAFMRSWRDEDVERSASVPRPPTQHHHPS